MGMGMCYSILTTKLHSCRESGRLRGILMDTIIVYSNNLKEKSLGLGCTGVPWHPKGDQSQWENRQIKDVICNSEETGVLHF